MFAPLNACSTATLIIRSSPKYVYTSTCGVSGSVKGQPVRRSCFNNQLIKHMHHIDWATCETQDNVMPSIIHVVYYTK